MQTKKTNPEFWRDADVIGYVRKSLVLGEEDRISEVKQRDAIERECRALQLPEPAWYVDADGHRSGRHEHTRPSWQSAKARYLGSPRSVLVVYELDRSNRNVMAMAQLIDTIRTQPNRYRLVLVMNRYDSARDGWGAREIKSLLDDAVMAQFESDKASERMSHTIATLKAHRIPWGKYPYGFERVGRGMKARLVPGAYAADARDALSMFARGMSYAEIVAEMAGQNRPYFRVRRHYAPDTEPVPFPWTLERIRNLHEQVMAYAGYVAPAGNSAALERVRSASTDPLLVQHIEKYGYVKADTVTPIITEDLAEAVLQRRLANHNRSHYERSGWTPILSGIAWCGDRKLRAHAMRGKYTYRTRKGSPVSWDAEAVEQEIIRYVGSLRFPAAVVTGIRAALAERTNQHDAEALTARLAKMKQSMHDLERRFTMDGMDESIYRSVRSELSAAIADTERRLREPGLIDVAVAALENLGDVLRRAKRKNQWRALHAMFERVDLRPGGGVEQLTPRPWAHDAFRAMTIAWKAAPLPSVGVTNVWEQSGNAVSPFDAAEWLFTRVRVSAE